MKSLVKSPIVLAASLLTFIPAAQAQLSWVNPGMEGTFSTPSLPPAGWENVPFDAPHSLATIEPLATADVTGATGPTPGLGIAGFPKEGTTFTSGVIAQIFSDTFGQEGIRQSVSGFIIGATYEFSLWQAVLKQETFYSPGTAGNWLVYADGILVGDTAISSSAIPFDDPNKIWEQRTVTFLANDTSIEFDFLPFVGPGNMVDLNNGTRMGIDGLSDITMVPEPAGVMLLGITGALAFLGRRRGV